MAPGVVWAVDFQFDVDERGKAIKIGSILDEHTPECLGGLVERSITAERFITHLEKLVDEHGVPMVLRSGIGTEFICDAVGDWAGTRTRLSYLPPGQPGRNGDVESYS